MPQLTPALYAIAVLAAAVATDSAQAQPATAGKPLFQQRCAMCHANKAGAPATIGPNLSGVINRPAGSTAFAYSPALKSARISWTRDNLDRYLSGPAAMIPGVRMVVSVPDKADRAAIIAYLAAGN